MNKKNCIIIGSSFTSLVCVLNLIKNGYSPIVIDVCTNYKGKDTYTSILKPIFYKKKNRGLFFFWRSF